MDRPRPVRPEQGVPTTTHRTVELLPPTHAGQPVSRSPVFVDASGRRRRLATYLGLGVGGVLVIGLVAILMGLLGGPALRGPALPDGLIGSPTALASQHRSDHRLARHRDPTRAPSPSAAPTPTAAASATAAPSTSPAHGSAHRAHPDPPGLRRK